MYLAGVNKCLVNLLTNTWTGTGLNTVSKSVNTVPTSDYECGV